MHKIKIARYAALKDCKPALTLVADVDTALSRLNNSNLTNRKHEVSDLADVPYGGD
jgi:hypothetical protein